MSSRRHLPWLVRRFALRKRLSLVVWQAVLLVVLLGLVALLLANVTRLRVNELIRASDAARLMREVRIEVDGMQFDVYRAVIAGHDSAGVKIDQRFARARDLLATCRDDDAYSGCSGSAPDRLERLERHLQAFHAGYREAQAQQHRLTNSLHDDLHPLVNRLRMAFRGLDGKAGADVPPGIVQVNEVRLDLIEQQAQKLTAVAGPFHGTEIDDQIDALIADFDRLADRMEPGARAQAEAVLGELSRLMREMMQRARGYLFLVNVVVAADAFEMRVLAGLVESDLRARRDAVEQAIQTGTGRFVLIMLLLVLVGATLIYQSGNAITASVIGQIRRITRVFSELAGGSLDPVQFDSPHRDEIDDLVRAAQRFRDENIEIRDLLDRHEALNRQLELRVAERTRMLEDSNRELGRLARTDRLTGLLNRRALDEILREAIEHSERSGDALGIMFMDLDHFKDVNDTYGHETGDRVLVAVAECIRSQLVDGELAGRWGGEEFVVIGPGKDGEAMLALAERLRVRIQGSDLNGAAAITISIGVSARGPGDTLQSLVERADRALYRAKHLGRNRCESEA
ncbi:MAG: GGDEF domain-containing protein [Wenzhouxiangellaceae bacterium]|nr:GGDEF domain-containing protein [Wenzhouxiangellaceae bacterium]